MKELDMQQQASGVHKELSEEEIERVLGAWGSPHNPIDANKNLDTHIRNLRLGVVGGSLAVGATVGTGTYETVKHS